VPTCRYVTTHPHSVTASLAGPRVVAPGLGVAWKKSRGARSHTLPESPVRAQFLFQRVSGICISASAAPIASARLLPRISFCFFGSAIVYAPPAPSFSGRAARLLRSAWVLRNRGAPAWALLLDACRQIPAPQHFRPRHRRCAAFISSNAPHLISDSISSRSTERAAENLRASRTRRLRRASAESRDRFDSSPRTCHQANAQCTFSVSAVLRGVPIRE